MNYQEFHANLLAYESKWGKLGSGLLAHAGKPWKEHDYLYIDENGNYVYEEKKWGRSSNHQNRNKLTKLKGLKGTNTTPVSNKTETKKSSKEKTQESSNNNTIKTDQQIKEMQAATVKKYADIARHKSPQAAAREFMKEDAVTELLDEIEAGIKAGTITYTKNGALKVNDDKVKDNLKAFSANISKWANWIVGATSANGIIVQSELKKLINQKIKQYSREKRSVMHSAYDDRYTNYRRKVYQGTVAYNEQHKKTISIEELNRKYQEDQIKNKRVIEVEQKK